MLLTVSSGPKGRDDGLGTRDAKITRLQVFDERLLELPGHHTLFLHVQESEEDTALHESFVKSRLVTLASIAVTQQEVIHYLSTQRDSVHTLYEYLQYVFFQIPVHTYLLHP